jgi:hypothetical protein
VLNNDIKPETGSGLMMNINLTVFGMVRAPMVQARGRAGGFHRWAGGIIA